MRKTEEFLRKIAFNIRRDRELDLNRRGFIASTLSLMGVFFVSSTPLMALSRNREEVAENTEVFIANAEEIKIGESFAFNYPDENDPALLIRLDEDKFRAYNIKCTHLMCPVYWEPEEGHLECPCHHGFFNVDDGSVIAGPPQRPLPSIDLRFENEKIYAVGISQAQH